MFQEILQSMENSQFYSIVGLFLFVAAFIGIVYRAVRMDKSEVDEMSRLPLESRTPDHEESHD